MLDHSFWNNRRVLITGHTGFKGSWLMLWLHQLGAKIWGYSLHPPTTVNLFDSLMSEYRPSKNFYEKIADLSNKRALEEIINEAQPEVVFHLAAQSLVRKSYSDPLATWSTNVQGSLNLLDSLKSLDHICSIIMVTTDKVYLNREWNYGYRESDELGGHDPYSASKAAAELAIASWRASFCGDEKYQNPYLRIATARAGNVIGGGDWATDRIVPDAIRALSKGQPILVRNPLSTRPWQHVLEPLNGYIRLAETIYKDPSLCSAYNFGPPLQNNKTVSQLVGKILDSWPGKWMCSEDTQQHQHEANLLNLQTDKAYHILGWKSRWDYTETVKYTIDWYFSVHKGQSPLRCCLSDLSSFQT